MDDDLVIDRSELGRIKFVAKGGQGSVYSADDLVVPGLPAPLAFKEYLPGMVSTAGLKRLVQRRAQLDPGDRARLDSFAAWPSLLVRSGGDMVGIVMPFVDEPFTQDRILPGNGHPVRSLREVQYLFVAPERAKKLGFPTVSLGGRLRLCSSFAAALAFLHAHDIVFGDISAKNALFSSAPGSERVMLVDCDAVRVKGSAAAVPQLNSPDWEPPLGEFGSLTERTDVFKFGLFVIRALSPGPMASAARSPERVEAVLDATGCQLVRASLAEAPAARPRMQDWADYFVSVGDGKNLLQLPPVAASTTGRWVRRDGDTWVDATTSAPARPVAPSKNWRSDPGGGWVKVGTP